MRKIVFVDDEKFVIENMLHEIDFAKADAKVVAVCENAGEALSYLATHPVDILVTDVSMPGENGLDMTESLRKSGWRGEVIFLSAYRRMDNMRRSFQFDTTDYLFKPVSEEEMQGAVREATRRANEKDERRRQLEAGKWRQLLAGNPGPLPETRFPAWCVCLSSGEEAPEDCEYAEKRGDEYLYVLGLAQCSEALARERFSAFQGARRAMGAPVARLDRLMLSLGHARDNMAMYGLSKTREEYRQAELVEAVAGALAKDEAALSGELAALRRALSASSGGFAELVGRAGVFYSCLAERLKTERARPGLTRLQLAFAKAGMSAKTAEELFDILNEYVRLLSRLIRESNGDAARFAELETLARENLRDITVDGLAERMKLSRSAVARLVKNAAGATVNDYLVNLRVKRACELLRDSDMPVYRVAEEVGYSDSQYFTRVFKSRLNLTPGEYRHKM